jgi:hypothetical protein
MTREEILREIKRIAAGNNATPPGKQKFTTETGITESAWAGKYWARWSDALRDAGFSANTWQLPHEEEFLMESYIKIIRELGHFPVVRELQLRRRLDSRFPSDKSFNRFGSKSNAASRIVEFCRAHSGYDDVLKICESLATRSAARSRARFGAQPELGFVYLLRSGRYYKIGRSNAAGRREYELAIQLPEKAVKLHEIRTDDPPGIEAYWHNRFAAKRRGGEWFDLDASDVNTFKRRKFM